MLTRLTILFNIIYENWVYLRISKRIVKKVLSNIDLIMQGENIVYVSSRNVYCLNGEIIKFLKDTNYDKDYRIRYVFSNLYQYTREEFLSKNPHLDNNFLNAVQSLLNN